jgi:nickel transport protein
MEGTFVRTLSPACTVAAAVVLFSTSPALAHRLSAEVKLRGDQVEVEAFFDDDTPAGDAHVAVLDAKQKTIVEGHTDAKGLWTFKAPESGVYQVVVNAGDGHRARVPITIPVEQSSEVTTTFRGLDDPESARQPTPMAQDVPRTISEGPTRAEATQFPWTQVSLGLALIATLGFALRFLLQRSRDPGSGG